MLSVARIIPYLWVQWSQFYSLPEWQVVASMYKPKSLAWKKMSNSPQKSSLAH